MKIGACCKWLDNQGELIRRKNFRITTVAGLTAKTPAERHAVLLEIVQHNLYALWLVVNRLADRPPAARMWRMGSDLLPVATHEITAAFYADPETERIIQQGLARIGARAREAGVRLSFHPGQFVVIGSQHAPVRARAHIELEYHAGIAHLMGYRGWHQDGFSINVHVGGKQADPRVVRKEISRMSQTLRNTLTFENDEFSWSAQNIVQRFGDLVPCVLDVHHYWITHGERLDPHGHLADRIKHTWRGARPKLHLAISQQELVPKRYWRTDIPLQPLLDAGLTRGKLRIHGTAWHPSSIAYAAEFRDWDIQWEGVDKTVGQRTIINQLGLG